MGLTTILLARQLPQGSIDVVDVQSAMLESVMQRAERRGIHNVTPTLCSAESLPFPDESFDIAILLGVLGEIREPGVVAYIARFTKTTTGTGQDRDPQAD